MVANIQWNTCGATEVRVQVSSVGGCVKELLINIPIIESDFDITGNLSICTNAGLSYTCSNGTPTSTWEWFLNNSLVKGPVTGSSGTSYTLIPSLLNLPPGPCTLKVVRKINGDCEAVVTKIIQINAKPSVDISASTEAFCPGIPVTFNAIYSGALPGSYVWKIGSEIQTETTSSFTHTFAGGGSYSVKVKFVPTGSGYCHSDFVEYPFDVPLMDFEITSALAECHSHGNGTFQLSCTPVEDASYCWHWAGAGYPPCLAPSSNSITLPVSNYLTNEYVKLDYEVLVDVGGCSSSKGASIELYKNPFKVTTSTTTLNSKPDIWITTLRANSVEELNSTLLLSEDDELPPIEICNGTWLRLDVNGIQSTFIPTLGTITYHWRRLMPSGIYSGDLGSSVVVYGSNYEEDYTYECFARIDGGCESGVRRVLVHKAPTPAVTTLPHCLTVVEPNGTITENVFVEITYPSGLTSVSNAFKNIYDPVTQLPSWQSFTVGTNKLRMKIFETNANLENTTNDGVYHAYFQTSESCIFDHTFTMLGNPQGSGSCLPYTYCGLQDPTFSGPVFINNPITFQNSSLDFDIDSKIYFRGQAAYDSNPIGGSVSGAGITLTNSWLKLANGTLLDATCDKMWNGITVGTGSTVFADGAIFKNAYKAIDIQSNASGDNVVSHCSFHNNYYGIVNSKSGIFSFTENTFDSDFSTMAKPFDANGNSNHRNAFAFSFAHLTLGDGVVTNAATQISGNHFNHGLYGIYAGIEATVKANGNSFDNCYLASVRLANEASGQPHSITGATDLNMKIPNVLTIPDRINDAPFAYEGEWASVSASLGLTDGKTSFGILGFGDFPITGLQITGNTITGSGPHTTTGVYPNQTGVLLRDAQNVAITDNSSISDPTFPGISKLKEGIRLEGTDSDFLVTDISRNTLSDNGTSLLLHSGNYSLSMGCNIFQTDDATYRIGLHLGNAVALENDGIGGNGVDPSPNPNANIWPRKPGVNPVTSPDNWISIKKPDVGGLIYYYKYSNEFLGTVEPELGSNYIFPSPHKSAKSPKFVRDWCEATFSGNQIQIDECIGDPMNTAGWNSQWVSVCGNLDDETEYFGARQAVLNNTTTSIVESNKDQIFLGEPFPNPSNQTTTIDLNWPKEKGTLVVFEMGSGKLVWESEIGKGRQKLQVPVNKLASGVYGYRLEGECPCPEPKRLIVIH